MLTSTEERMVENFITRYNENKDKKRVDNSSLYAGSPMYYYCRACMAFITTLPETHLSAPPRYCEYCSDLRDKALMEEALRRVKS